MIKEESMAVDVDQVLRTQLEDFAVSLAWGAGSVLMQPSPLAYWQTRAQRRVRVDGWPVLKITSTLASALGSIVTLQSGQI